VLRGLPTVPLEPGFKQRETARIVAAMVELLSGAAMTICVASEREQSRFFILERIKRGFSPIHT
jgi:hypothetical protein